MQLPNNALNNWLPRPYFNVTYKGEVVAHFTTEAEAVAHWEMLKNNEAFHGEGLPSLTP